MAESALPPPPGINDARGRAVAAVLDRFSHIDLTKLLIYRIDTVEPSALPFLVDQFDLHDMVDGEAPEATVRSLIKQAIALRRTMGTPWAVKAALTADGLWPELVEWWQEVPRGQPHTFRLTAFVTDLNRPLDAARIRRAVRLVDAAKRKSQHHAFRLGAAFAAELRLAGAAMAANRFSGRGTARLSFAGRGDLGMAITAHQGPVLSARASVGGRDTLATLLGISATAHGGARLSIIARQV